MLFFLRWICCYVEDDITSKCYEHKVNGSCAPTNAFKTDLCMWRANRLMCISPMVLWWMMTFFFMSMERNLKVQNNYMRFLWENTHDISWWTWKDQQTHWNSGQHITDMLSACRTNSGYSQCFKFDHNELQLLSGEPQPVPSIYDIMYIYIYMCDVCTYIYI